MKDSVHTSKAITPKAYVSLAFVGYVDLAEFGNIPGQANSGAWPRESRSLLIVPLAIPAMESGRMDALPRPEIRTVPSLSIKMFV